MGVKFDRFYPLIVSLAVLPLNVYTQGSFSAPNCPSSTLIYIYCTYVSVLYGTVLSPYVWLDMLEHVIALAIFVGNSRNINKLTSLTRRSEIWSFQLIHYFRLKHLWMGQCCCNSLPNIL